MVKYFLYCVVTNLISATVTGIPYHFPESLLLKCQSTVGGILHFVTGSLLNEMFPCLWRNIQDYHNPGLPAGSDFNWIAPRTVHFTGRENRGANNEAGIVAGFQPAALFPKHSDFKSTLCFGGWISVDQPDPPTGTAVSQMPLYCLNSVVPMSLMTARISLDLMLKEVFYVSFTCSYAHHH